MLRRRVIWGLDQGTNAQQLGNMACGSATRPQAHSEDVRGLEEATLDCISVLIPALKLTYHGRFHRSCVSWGLQLGNLAFSGVLVSGAGLEPLLGHCPGGQSILGLQAFKTQLPGGGVVTVPVLLAIWPPRSPVIMWPPHKQLLQRLKASLLRSPYKSSDPLLSTLPANQGPNGCCTHACTHTCPPNYLPAGVQIPHHHP